MADTAKSAGPTMRLPQVDRILREPLLVAKEKEVRREVLAVLTRAVLTDYRTNENRIVENPLAENPLPNSIEATEITPAQVAEKVCLRVDEILAGRLRRVINGTGVILNTNLGRAPLPASVVADLIPILSSYSSLEISLASGKRGERIETIAEILRVITGCEAALVVNNNAAAVMLAVRSLAFGKEVIISRGELIEIGGSFRLPEVVEAAGGVLKEVGTTNRTRISDYANAINEKSGLILKCHRSNFAITGFTEQADEKELAAIARKNGLPIAHDLGSGALINLDELGLTHEPTVQETLVHADIVMFSGDKLLGGTQAGLVIGQKRYIEMMRKQAIYRALRPDKLAVALAESILCQYLRPDVTESIPVYRMAKASQEQLNQRAQKMATDLNGRLKKLSCSAVPTTAAFGGGTTPAQELPSYGLRISTIDGASQKNENASAHKLAGMLRENHPAVISIIVDDRVTIDLRTIDQSEEIELALAIEAVDQRL
jgi:L-seryl-tRNA(Ser) seleniumtransferase